jgi:uncharacterized membrane-anchored protein
MPGKTKLALSPRGEGLVVAEDAAQVMEEIGIARRDEGFDGFVALTADSGTTVYVAVDKILFIEPDAGPGGALS